MCHDGVAVVVVSHPFYLSAWTMAKSSPHLVASFGLVCVNELVARLVSRTVGQSDSRTVRQTDRQAGRSSCWQLCIIALWILQCGPFAPIDNKLRAGSLADLQQQQVSLL